MILYTGDMTFNITESLYLNELMTSERYINSSLLDKIDFLNRARSSKRFWSYGINWFSKIIEDQPSKKIAFQGLIWKGKTCADILLYKDTRGEYMIQYPTNTELSSPDNTDGPVLVFEPEGKTIVNRHLSRFNEHGQSSHRSNMYQNTEHNKFLRYLKSVYEWGWLELKRTKVDELKKSIDKTSVEEYRAARRANRTVAVMKLGQISANLFAAVETYRKSIPNISSGKEAEQLLSQIEKAFYSLRSEQARIRWIDIEHKKRLPGGKKSLQASEENG